MKRALIIIIIILISIGTTGVWILYRQAQLVQQLDANYLLVEKGMSKAQVIELMGKGGRMRVEESATAGYWDDERLSDDEGAQIQSSVSYSVATIFLPITFEFSFCEKGKLVGRHIYD